MAKKTLEERFWEKVDVRGPGDCWEWLCCKSENGYGQIAINGKTIRAHRVSFEINFEKKIDVGLYILHSCDNRSCVNPYHLRQGTHKENMGDRLMGGPWANGSKKKAVTYAGAEKIWVGAEDAHRETGVGPESISRCCNGKRKSAGGFKWYFVDEQKKDKPT